MSDNDQPKQPPKGAPLGMSFAHLNVQPGAGQSKEWQAREYARRKGRRTKEWFKNPTPPPR